MMFFFQNMGLVIVFKDGNGSWMENLMFYIWDFGVASPCFCTRQFMGCVWTWKIAYGEDDDGSMNLGGTVL